MLNRCWSRNLLAGLTLAGVCLTAVPAGAQIYSWRDANGNLVLSNRRQGDAAPSLTHAVPRPNAPTPPAARTTPSRRGAYDELIVEHARRNGVRPDLVRAVVQVESAFNPNATSPKGAMGLMQLMPATMRQYGVSDAYNPVENVRAGVRYLRDLLDRYENDETLALAAYNAGPGAVDKYDESVPPYRETQNYVAKINQMAGVGIQRRGSVIYKTTEVVNGRVIVRFTDRRPATTPYELVGGR